jgi:hypothetical protein
MPTRLLPATPRPWLAIVRNTESEVRAFLAVEMRVVTAVAIASLGLAGLARAQPAARSAPIYSCDVNGKKVTSDRPIPECNNQDQRLLNPDGSVKSVVPPTPTADEREKAEQKERDDNIKRMEKMDAVRRDRNLMARFPDEAAHKKAREMALNDVAKSVNVSKTRVALLIAERKPLLDEAEFYVNKPLPAKLKIALDANDASLAAQNSLIQNQQAEEVRINALYDAELARLRKLWAGAPAGSLGPASAATPTVKGGSGR